MVVVMVMVMVVVMVVVVCYLLPNDDDENDFTSPHLTSPDPTSPHLTPPIVLSLFIFFLFYTKEVEENNRVGKEEENIGGVGVGGVGVGVGGGGGGGGAGMQRGSTWAREPFVVVVVGWLVGWLVGYRCAASAAVAAAAASAATATAAEPHKSTLHRSFAVVIYRQRPSDGLNIDERTF
ncbi:hypothetical protein M0804_009603 [Polistes exclamans]|nr:hypothetical protein M0804_009603 [Polistes exclamans]